TYEGASGVSRLYVNGAVVAEQTLGTFTPATNLPLHLGLRPPTSADGRKGARYGGLMDEVHLFNRALTTTEVQSIYNAGSTGLAHSAAPQFSVSPKQAQWTGSASTQPTYTMTGSGYSPNETVNITGGPFNNIQINADAAGSFSVKRQADGGGLGTYTINAAGTTSHVNLSSDIYLQRF